MPFGIGLCFHHFLDKGAERLCHGYHDIAGMHHFIFPGDVGFKPRNANAVLAEQVYEGYQFALVVLLKWQHEIGGRLGTAFHYFLAAHIVAEQE